MILSRIRTASDLKLVNLSCGLGPIITRYDFRDAGRVILNIIQTDSKFKLIIIFTLLVDFSCELGYMITSFDLIASYANYVEQQMEFLRKQSKLEFKM